MTKITETLADIMNEAGRMVVTTYITKLHAEELATQGRGASKKQNIGGFI